MQWDSERLIKALQAPLPGKEAHDEVFSYSRPSVDHVLSTSSTYRTSAVVFLVYPRNEEWHFLLLKRHDYGGVHSGQVGFPGGRQEEGELLIETGIRELHEETGLKLEQDSVLGPLTPLYIPPSDFLVYPYSAIVNDEPEWMMDNREVRYALEVPLNELTHGRGLQDVRVPMSGAGHRIKVKAFVFQDEIVWGATAMMLAECKRLLDRFTL